ncbi:hypothetical protein Q7O_002857 [Pectobacterium carotovorum subsp. carotovorum PCCS1]|nr:hypothetical protein [Pectobacterium carotovorum subsp. carotovorum PCCS1]
MIFDSASHAESVRKNACLKVSLARQKAFPLRSVNHSPPCGSIKLRHVRN